MANDVQQAKDDIAYIKGFLKDSGQAPLLIGHLYLLQGVVVALAALRQYPIEMGWDVPGILTAFMPWDLLAVVLAGFAISSTLLWRRGRPAEMVPAHKLSAGIRAANAAWGAVTIAVIIGVFCLWTSSIEGLAVAGLILFAVCWAIGWLVTYAVLRAGWHGLVGAGFFVFAVAVSLTGKGAALALVVAAGWLLLFALPGWLIIRDAGREAKG